MSSGLDSGLDSLDTPLTTVWSHRIVSQADRVQNPGDSGHTHSLGQPTAASKRGTGNSNSNLSAWIDERLRKCGFVPQTAGAVQRPSDAARADGW